MNMIIKLVNKIVVVTVLLPSITMCLYAYDTFGVGINTETNPLHSATFYKNNFIKNGDVYYGADFLHFGIGATIDQTRDYETGSGYEDEITSEDGKLSISLLMPRLGYRKPFKKIGSVQSYNQIEGYLIIPMLKTSGELKLDSETEDEVKDALNLFGLKFSHSIEYNFSDQLALVADVGVNWIFWESSQKSTSEGWNYTTKSESQLNANLSITYTKLSLHFKLKN